MEIFNKSVVNWFVISYLFLVLLLFSRRQMQKKIVESIKIYMNCGDTIANIVLIMLVFSKNLITI